MTIEAANPNEDIKAALIAIHAAEDASPRAVARQTVYEAIDTEREYQDMQWNDTTTTTKGMHTVTEFVLYMEHYLGEARRLLSTQASPKADEDGLDFVRKVTALGVCCMEQNGIVPRIIHRKL
jgi:hypothetical protein